jgi:hypothetical protein
MLTYSHTKSYQVRRYFTKMKTKAEKRRERRLKTILKYAQIDMNVGDNALNTLTKGQRQNAIDSNPFDIMDGIHTTAAAVDAVDAHNTHNAHNTQNTPATETHLNGIQVKWNLQQIPKELLKYYHQRYSYFHKFDDCWIDYEGFYSVTPEVIAKHTAKRLQGYNVVDG